MKYQVVRKSFDGPGALQNYLNGRDSNYTLVSVSVESEIRLNGILQGYWYLITWRRVKNMLKGDKYEG